MYSGYNHPCTQLLPLFSFISILDWTGCELVLPSNRLLSDFSALVGLGTAWHVLGAQHLPGRSHTIWAAFSTKNFFSSGRIIYAAGRGDSHNLDDFLFAGHTQPCRHQLQQVLEIRTRLGASMALEKVEGLSTTLLYLCINIDTIKGVVSVPTESYSAYFCLSTAG